MLLVTKRPTPLFLLFHEKWYISIVDSFLNMLNWSRWANWKTPYPDWGSNEYINSYILAPYDRNVDSFSIRQTRLVIIWQAYLWSHNNVADIKLYTSGKSMSFRQSPSALLMTVIIISISILHSSNESLEHVSWQRANKMLSNCYMLYLHISSSDLNSLTVRCAVTYLTSVKNKIQFFCWKSGKRATSI